MLLSLETIRQIFFGGRFNPSTYTPVIAQMKSIVSFYGTDYERLHKVYRSIEYNNVIPTIYKPSDGWQSPLFIEPQIPNKTKVNEGIDMNPAYYTQLARNTIPLAVDILSEGSYQSRKYAILPYSLKDAHIEAFEEPYKGRLSSRIDYEHREPVMFLQGFFSFYEGSRGIISFLNNVLDRVESVINSLAGLKAMK